MSLMKINYNNLMFTDLLTNILVKIKNERKQIKTKVISKYTYVNFCSVMPGKVS